MITTFAGPSVTDMLWADVFGSHRSNQDFHCIGHTQLHRSNVSFLSKSASWWTGPILLHSIAWGDNNLMTVVSEPVDVVRAGNVWSLNSAHPLITKTWSADDAEAR